MIVVCALLPIFLGAVLVYLTHGQQQWLHVTAPFAVRIAGFISIAAGTAMWCVVSGVGAGIATALSSLMLTWVALPYLAWWSGRSAKTARARKR